MDNPYSGELPKINKIAEDVQTVLGKISQLELQASNLQTEISQVPYQTDEDGYDVNEGQRNALYAQLDSVNSLIEEANEARHQLQSEAYALVSDYQSKISIFEKQAQKTAKAKSSFDVLSGYRFGARTAAAGSQLADQRKTHYDDQVSVLRSLLEAAQNAANGILMTTTLQTISERGEFNDPKTIFYGNHLENNQGVNEQKNDLENNWSGIPGDSIKNTNDNIAISILGNLGMTGIPYHGGKPDFSNVSLAKVNTTMSDVGMVAAADAMLAKEYGVTEDDIVSYRQENGLEWRDDGSGNNANLIPQNISQAFDEGREKKQEPTAMEALTAYMYAHNYTKSDYNVYSQDPEWIRLHNAAFPEYHQEHIIEPMEPNRSTPRDLAVTQYSFKKDNNGEEIYDSPLELSKYLYAEQGTADPRFLGTCGLCSCANILRLAGVNATEKEMIEYASHTRVEGGFFKHLCTVNRLDANKSGGTTPNQRQKILEHYGIRSSIIPVKQDSNGYASYEAINELGQYVADGRGVIIDVDAGAFYNDLRMNGCGHAVTLTSVTKNKYGDISGFYIADSNRGTVFYPAWRIREAIRPFVGVNVTNQIIR